MQYNPTLLSAPTQPSKHTTSLLYNYRQLTGVSVTFPQYTVCSLPSIEVLPPTPLKHAYEAIIGRERRKQEQNNLIGVYIYIIYTYICLLLALLTDTEYKLVTIYLTSNVVPTIIDIYGKLKQRLTAEALAELKTKILIRVPSVDTLWSPGYWRIYG